MKTHKAITRLPMQTEIAVRQANGTYPDNVVLASILFILNVTDAEEPPSVLQVKSASPPQY